MLICGLSSWGLRSGDIRTRSISLRQGCSVLLVCLCSCSWLLDWFGPLCNSCTPHAAPGWAPLFGLREGHRLSWQPKTHSCPLTFLLCTDLTMQGLAPSQNYRAAVAAAASRSLRLNSCNLSCGRLSINVVLDLKNSLRGAVKAMQCNKLVCGTTRGLGLQVVHLGEVNSAGRTLLGDILGLLEGWVSKIFFLPSAGAAGAARCLSCRLPLALKGVLCICWMVLQTGSCCNKSSQLCKLFLPRFQLQSPSLPARL